MSTRSYSGTLVFENLFDAIPAWNTNLVNAANGIFTPAPTVVEEDCGTLLGEVTSLIFELEGEVEVTTGIPMTRSFIEGRLASGQYEVQIRNLSTCISDGGVCKKCYNASFPSEALPDVGSRVQVPSEFQIQSEVIVINEGESSSALSYDNSSYDKIIVIKDGVVVSDTIYTVVDKTITFNNPMKDFSSIVVKYKVNTRAPFMYWLAKTYGGSLLGMKAISVRPLTLKQSLFSSLISENDVESIISRISNSPLVPEDMKMYFPNTRSMLEKALLAVAVESVFSNAT